MAAALDPLRVRLPWVSGKPATAATAGQPAESVEERLRRLDDLLKKGLITKEEHDRKRAEILKDM